MTKSEKEEFYRLLGMRIRDARTKIKLKQETFATLLGLSRASIVNIEKGRQHPPIYLLWDISKILSIQVSDLLPDFEIGGEVDSQLERLVAKGSTTKETEEKLLGFIKDI